MSLEWKWMTPDQPGLWAYGSDSHQPDFSHVICVKSSDAYGSGATPSWWCRIGSIPEIASPKQRIKRTLWINPTVPVMSLASPADDPLSSLVNICQFRYQWCDRDSVPAGINWYRTDIDREFEE